MIRRALIFVAFLLFIFSAGAQKSDQKVGNNTSLVVGIVVDQMRYDYLFRFSEKYTEGGFKRLLRNGFSCKNANFGYVPTHTAPGHASIFTGTSPSVHGIIGNDWFDRNLRKEIYCVADSTVKPVGTTSISGKMSPRNLFATTFADELKLSTNFKSRSYGVSLKDRGSILPVGHTANTAYWHDPYLNNWVTSTYYINELPKWVSDFNARKVSDSLLSKPWNTLLPISSYTECGPDNSPHEGLYKGEKSPVFPHNLPSLREAESELIRKTPFGNTFTRMFAESLISQEKLGQGDFCDVLTVSFSSTDYIGHMYGTNAVELEDTYVRLDRELELFLNYLDKTIGEGKYLLFLTSDHGAAHNPGFLDDHKVPADFINNYRGSDSIREFINRAYGDQAFTLDVSSGAVYLNRPYIMSKGIDPEEVARRCAEFIETLPGVSAVYTFGDMTRGATHKPFFSFYQNGYYASRSADIIIQYRPAWLSWYNKTGTTHGAAYSYDTHVPLIFFGTGISSGSTSAAIDISDIAPTICSLLNIEFPNGSTGKPIQEILDK
ncbi:MAG TPA: alkaline phosphatase family protein [Bacteroidia bacterium]|nr:alkaline phosphatase family protein [Bacteroidia bacterium]HNS12329.1 alkaline phosphatase family protein [Bacteroidia bacterium]